MNISGGHLSNCKEFDLKEYINQEKSLITFCFVPVETIDMIFTFKLILTLKKNNFYVFFSLMKFFTFIFIKKD